MLVLASLPRRSASLVIHYRSTNLVIGLFVSSRESPDCLPILGPVLVSLIRGGTSVGQATLSRFYTVHTLLLPVINIGLPGGAL